MSRKVLETRPTPVTSYFVLRPHYLLLLPLLSSSPRTYKSTFDGSLVVNTK